MAGCTQAGFRPSSATSEGSESGWLVAMAMKRGGENGAFLARPSTCCEPPDCSMISVNHLEAAPRPGLRPEKMSDAMAAMRRWRCGLSGLDDLSKCPSPDVMEGIGPSTGGAAAGAALPPIVFGPQRPCRARTVRGPDTGSGVPRNCGNEARGPLVD